MRLHPDDSKRRNPDGLASAATRMATAAALLIVAAGNTEAQIANLTFNESTSGNYSAAAELTSSDPGQGTVLSTITFNNVAIGTTPTVQDQRTIGAFSSSTEVTGKVTRTQADPSSTYTVVTELSGDVISSDLNPKAPTNALSIRATYSDQFWTTDPGGGANILGFTLTPTPGNNITFPQNPISTGNLFNLVFHHPDPNVPPIVIDSLFGPNKFKRQFNISFEEFGPDELYTMTLNLSLDSAVKMNGQQTQPNETMTANLSANGTIESVPFATIQISDGIPNRRTYRFEVIPEPSSLALLGLGGLLIPRRRTRLFKPAPHEKTHHG